MPMADQALLRRPLEWGEGVEMQVSKGGPVRPYVIAVALAAVALVGVVVSHIAPREGYPLTFVFTMCAVLAYSWPSWEHSEKRGRMLVMGFSAFVIELAI